MDTVIVVGGAVVVVLGSLADVGRIGAMSADVVEETVDCVEEVLEWMEDVDEEWVELPLVTVATFEVTAVDVDVTVVGSVEAAGRGATNGVLDVDEVSGEAVTTGWIVVVTVEFATPGKNISQRGALAGLDWIGGMTYIRRHCMCNPLYSIPHLCFQNQGFRCRPFRQRDRPILAQSRTGSPHNIQHLHTLCP